MWYDFLSKHRLRFNRQKIINHYIVDFYCAKAKLIIEIDGQTHFDKKQEKYDEQRTKTLEGYGLTVLRFYNNEIENDFDEVCKKIDDFMQENTR